MHVLAFHLAVMCKKIGFPTPSRACIQFPVVQLSVLNYITYCHWQKEVYYSLGDYSLGGSTSRGVQMYK